MKRRYLRPGIEHALCAITALLLSFVMMIDYIELRFIPVMLTMLSIITVNLLILKKYGKGIWLNGKY